MAVMHRAKREQRSLSCTDTQWHGIEARAAAAGMSVSRFLIDSGLAVDGHKLRLSAGRQLKLVDDVSALTAAVLKPLPDTGVNLREAITFLYREYSKRPGASRNRTS